jgi:hypothetical protein
MASQHLFHLKTTKSRHDVAKMLIAPNFCNLAMQKRVGSHLGIKPG